MPLEPYVSINNVKYRVDPPSYDKHDAQRFAPIIRDGFVSGATLKDESEIGWADWSGGGFLAKYREDQPSRYSFSTNIWAATPGQIVLGPKRQTTSVIAAAVTVLKTPLDIGRIAALTAVEVFLRDSGADTFSSKLATVTPTDIIEFDGNVYVGMGSTNAYQYTADITLSPPVWTISNLGTAGNAQRANLWAADMAGTGASGGRLWKSVSPNNVYSSADPRNGTGAWTTAYLVGSSNWNINSLRIIDDRLIVGKPEGIFWLNPAGTVQLLFSFRDAIHTGNATVLVQTHTGIVMANWMHGLIAFRPGSVAMNVTLQDIWQQFAPSIRTSDQETRGRVVAGVAGPAATYFILNDTISGNYYLLLWTGEGLDRGWHVIHTFTSINANVIGFEQPNAANARVYTRNGSGSPFYFIMPRDTEEPRNDTGFQFESPGIIEMSEYTSSLPETPKIYKSVRMRAENLLAGSQYVDISYFLDGGTETTLRRIESSGSSNTYFPSSTSGRRMRIRFTVYGTSTASPRIRAVYLVYKLTPDSQKEWVMNLMAEPGSGDERYPFNVETDLQTVKDANSGVDFTDLDGARYTATIEEINIRYHEQKHEHIGQIAIMTRLLQQSGTVGACFADNESAVLDDCYAA